MRVATSPEIAIYTRDHPQLPGGSLDIRWEDFKTSTHRQRSRRHTRVYYLESTAEPPILWLNKGIPDLSTVLESKGTTDRASPLPAALLSNRASQHVAAFEYPSRSASHPTRLLKEAALVTLIADPLPGNRAKSLRCWRASQQPGATTPSRFGVAWPSLSEAGALLQGDGLDNVQGRPASENPG